MADAASWLARIRGLNLHRPVRILNVCGGHERSIGMAGLRDILPAEITLIPGPGCPVCVCPQADILAAIRLAFIPGHILVAFGDMLRVPANVPKGEIRSLAQARVQGADIRPISSPQEAVAIAAQNPAQNVIFFAAGFETTAAPVAAMLAQTVPKNLLVLLALRRTWPAVAMLLESGQANFDALIAPGHVATVMGAEEWRFVPDQHNMPAAIAGFTPAALLAGLYALLRQLAAKRPALDNAYPELVRPYGNTRATACMAAQFDDEDAAWRGIGRIPRSGLALKPRLAAHDARQRFPETITTAIETMPPGCDCASVVLGRISPLKCRLYGKACTPRTPIGPCMVSDEGACRIWWSTGQRAEPASMIA
jgi:hydrogenase expression/formation protein HypD